MLEFNVPVAAGAGVDDGRAQGARGEPPVRRVVVAAPGRSRSSWSARGRGRPRCVDARLRRRRPRRLRARVARPPPPAPGADARRRDPALERFYAQRARLVAVPATSSSARRSTVPLDYADPGGETIDLALLKAPGRRPGRHGRLAGGQPRRPGRARHDVRRSRPAVPSASRCSTHFDIVGFDPRGTGAAATRSTASRDAELDDYLAGDPDPDTAAEERDYLARLTRVRRRAASSRSGELAAHVSTVEAARDMDVLRAALGRVDADLPRRVLRHLARRDVRRAVPRPGRPAGPRRRASTCPLDSPRAGARAGRRASRPRCAPTSQNCVDATDSCFLGDSVDEGLAPDPATSSTRSTQQPLPTGDGPRARGRQRVLRHRRCRSTTATTGSSSARRCERRSTATAPTLLRLADLYASRDADGSYADNSIEAIYAINCLDDPYVDPAVARCRPSSRRSRRPRRPSAGSSPGG